MSKNIVSTQKHEIIIPEGKTIGKDVTNPTDGEIFLSDIFIPDAYGKDEKLDFFVQKNRVLHKADTHGHMQHINGFNKRLHLDIKADVKWYQIVYYSEIFKKFYPHGYNGVIYTQKWKKLNGEETSSGVRMEYQVKTKVEDSSSAYSDGMENVQIYVLADPITGECLHMYNDNLDHTVNGIIYKIKNNPVLLKAMNVSAVVDKYSTEYVSEDLTTSDGTTSKAADFTLFKKSGNDEVEAFLSHLVIRFPLEYINLFTLEEQYAISYGKTFEAEYGRPVKIEEYEDVDEDGDNVTKKFNVVITQSENPLVTFNDEEAYNDTNMMLDILNMKSVRNSLHKLRDVVYVKIDEKYDALLEEYEKTYDNDNKAYEAMNDARKEAWKASHGGQDIYYDQTKDDVGSVAIKRKKDKSEVIYTKMEKTLDAQMNKAYIHFNKVLTKMYEEKRNNTYPEYGDNRYKALGKNTFPIYDSDDKRFPTHPQGKDLLKDLEDDSRLKNTTTPQRGIYQTKLYAAIEKMEWKDKSTVYENKKVIVEGITLPQDNPRYIKLKALNDKLGHEWWEKEEEDEFIKLLEEHLAGRTFDLQTHDGETLKHTILDVATPDRPGRLKTYEEENKVVKLNELETVETSVPSDAKKWFEMMMTHGEEANYNFVKTEKKKVVERFRGEEAGVRMASTFSSPEIISEPALFGERAPLNNIDDAMDSFYAEMLGGAGEGMDEMAAEEAANTKAIAGIVDSVIAVDMGSIDELIATNKSNLDKLRSIFGSETTSSAAVPKEITLPDLVDEESELPPGDALESIDLLMGEQTSIQPSRRSTISRVSNHNLFNFVLHSN